MRAPASLRGRLILAAAIAVAVAILVTGIVLWFALDRFVRGQIDGRLDAQAAAVIAAVAAAPDADPRLLRPLDGPPFDRRNSGWAWEYRRGDRVLFRSRSLGDGAIALDDAAGDRGDRPRAVEATGPRGEALWARVRRAPGGASVVATAPLAAIHGPLRDVVGTVAAALAAIAALLVGAILLQVGLGLRPLRRLQGDLAAVRAGRVDRIPADQPAELRPVVAELNGLLAENAETLTRARTHVANLAHGLKTPLATLALALSEPGRDPGGRLRREIDAMDGRVRHHLRRARAAALAGPARAATDLAPRLADLQTAFARLYAARSLDIAVAAPAGLSVACEGEDVDEMLGNLVDNACQWARGRVVVAATAEGRTVRIRIEDDGPGLDAAGREAALQPGRRLDEAVPGNGFGLPITRELAELYGGALALGPSPLGGLGIVLTLPAARTP